MKKALVALDSTSCTGKIFARFCEVLRLFQDRGVISKTASVASIHHVSLTPMPLDFYAEQRPRLMREAAATIKEAAQDRFDFDSVRVLGADSSASEDHVEQLSKYAGRIGADLLVIGSHDRSGIPYWFLGSFAETAALRASVPVLILKPYLPALSLAKEPKFVVTVDVAALPPEDVLKWILDLALGSKASLEFVYVLPKYRLVVDKLQERQSHEEAKKKLEGLRSHLAGQGVKAKFKVLNEDKSIAHTISCFADQASAWLIIATAPERSRSRRLFLGSRARKILALTKRPFLSVR